MNAKHTPGPWKVEERTKRGTYGQPVKGCATSISVSANTVLFHCAVIADGSNLETAKANAALIAAAPELLAALEALYALVQGESPSLLEDDHHDEMIRAAIAKATRV